MNRLIKIIVVVNFALFPCSLMASVTDSYKDYLIISDNITDTIIPVTNSQRSVKFLLSFGAGLKYFATAPRDQVSEGYKFWENSYSGLVSFEIGLNRKFTHLLGVELNIYNSGEYKAQITNISPSIAYRYRYNFSEDISISGKLGINLPSHDFLDFCFFHQALLVEYKRNNIIYSLQYRTDFISTSPNFILLGVGLTFN